MASSSVSQDDIDNDFEKNSRRSRIRTARARQINPSGCRMESSQVMPNAEQPEHVEVEDQNGSGISAGNYSANGKVAILLFLSNTFFKSMYRVSHLHVTYFELLKKERSVF